MKLLDVVAALEARYPAEWAEKWDRVGLVTGRPDQEIHRVLCVVDVTPETIAEAQAFEAQMILAHHPLLLDPVSSVAATTPTGYMIHEMIRGGIALYVAHTNADVANPGVSDALADALGIVGRMPLVPTGEGRGHGRVGRLPVQLPLREFAQLAARVLRTDEVGVRVAGDEARRITLVAVCGGSGGDFLPYARELKVDAYVTGDLKHHKVLDHIVAGGPALIDAGHWATEQPWLAEVAGWLGKETRLDVVVSQARTDPWTLSLKGHRV